MLYTCILCVTCLLFDVLVPSPPRDLVVTSKFVDYKPVVTLTWNVSVCVCIACVRAYSVLCFVCVCVL